jgi:hypothetical protein
MSVAGISLTVSQAAGEDVLPAGAARAGAQFEAILLNIVFADLERTFSQLPGASEDPISRSYSGFGMEALTSGLARNGGIGLGAFIAKSLLSHNSHPSSGV